MPGAVNSLLGPPPIQTPLNQQGDQTGVPFQERGQPKSELNVQWLAWFNALYAKQLLAPQVVSVTQSELVSLAAFLATFNAVVPPNFDPSVQTVSLGTGPFLAYVTEYNHTLQWTGTSWEWGPGESGSGMLVPFAIAPTGAGWHACDGTIGVSYLKSDGTLGTVTLPDTVSTPAYVKLGASYTPTISAAVAPTIGAATFTGTPATLTGSVGAIAQTATGGVNVLVASTTSVAVEAHTHPAPSLTMNSYTPAGTITAPTSTLPADPVANFEALLFFRQ